MSLPGWNDQNVLNLTIDNSKIDGDLDYFPVLITLTSGSGQTSYDATYIFSELTISGVDSYTKLLLQCNGANASTNFLDVSGNGHLITANGNAQISTSQYIFNQSSGYFDATGDSLTTPASNDWSVGSSDFTIDFWIYTTSTPDNDYIFDIGSNGDFFRRLGNSWDFYSDGSYIFQKTEVVSNNAWHHIALVRYSGTTKLYIDGVEKDSSTTSYSFGDSSNVLTIGNYGGGGAYSLDGYLSEFRISKGIARWTSGFDVPSGPYGCSWGNRKKIAVTTTISGVETKLFTEIERWDDTTASGNKQAWLWTKVPTIASGTNTELYFYYDKNQDNQDERTLAEANDTFTGNNGDVLDQSRWRTQAGTPTIQNNKVRLVRTSTVKDTVYSRYEVTGDFDVQVDYSVPSPPSAVNSWQFMLRIRIDGSNYISVGRWGNATDQDYLKSINISGTPSYFHSAATTDTSGKLRITRSGSTWHGYYWYGSAWVEIGSGSAVGSDVITIVELMANSWSTNPAYTGYFDNFTVNSGTLSGFVGDTTEKPAQEVWDDNFKLVCHMDEDPNGDAANAIKDSTRNGDNGTPAGSMTTADLVDGQIAKNVDFDGGNDYIDFGDLFYSDKLTVECVMKADSYPTGVYKTLLVKRNNGLTHNGSGQEWYFCTYDKEIGFITYTTGGSTAGQKFSTTSPLPASGTRSYVAGVTTGNVGQSLKVFVGGVEISEDTSIAGAIQDGNCDIQIGCRAVNDNTRYFDGEIDEVRISNAARSDAWIKATYYSNWDNLITFEDGSVLEYYFSGDVYELGNTISGAQIFMYRRDTGAYLGATTSSGDGGFYVTTSYSGSHFLVCLDPAGGQSYNDLVYGEMYPVTISG